MFPHHECEIAQSESLTGEPFVRHWMHSAMVSYEGEKMSKSLGNLVFVSDLLKVADPRAIRLALLRHHYRAGFRLLHLFELLPLLMQHHPHLLAARRVRGMIEHQHRKLLAHERVRLRDYMSACDWVFHGVAPDAKKARPNGPPCNQPGRLFRRE